MYRIVPHGTAQSWEVGTPSKFVYLQVNIYDYVFISAPGRKQEGQGCYSLGLDNGFCEKGLYCNYPYIMAPMSRMLSPPPPSSRPPPFTCQGKM